MRSLYLLLIFVTVEIFGDKVKYNNYKLYRLTPKNLEEIKVIQNLEDSDLNVSFFDIVFCIIIFIIQLDFWKTSTGINTSSDVLVAPEKDYLLLEKLQKNGIKHEIVIPNVQT